MNLQFIALVVRKPFISPQAETDFSDFPRYVDSFSLLLRQVLSSHKAAKYMYFLREEGHVSVANNTWTAFDDHRIWRVSDISTVLRFRSDMRV